MTSSDHPSFRSDPGPSRPPGVRAAAAWAYLSVACPAQLDRFDDVALELADIERGWWERAESLVDQITVATVWKDRPEVTGWPGATPSRDELVEMVVDDLFALWRPPPEPPTATVAGPEATDDHRDSGADEMPSESDRWDWVLAHVALAQETGEPLSRYLGPTYLALWDDIVGHHPRLAALYRPDL